MEEEMRHDIIKWQTEGLRDATGILERVKKTENKEQNAGGVGTTFRTSVYTLHEEKLLPADSAKN